MFQAGLFPVVSEAHWAKKINIARRRGCYVLLNSLKRTKFSKNRLEFGAHATAMDFVRESDREEAEYGLDADDDDF